MGFFKNLFGTKQPSITTIVEFWTWFKTREIEFAAVIRSRDPAKMEKVVFEPLSEMLNQLRDGIYFQMGMVERSTAELVLTPEGNVKNIAFVEELVAAAPSINGWMFTAFKKPDTYIEMNGLKFGTDTLKFYPNDHDDMPDLVDITIVHNEFGGGSDDTISRGSFLFLDNYLGELDFLTKIDEISFQGPDTATKDQIPLDALPNFLDTRAALFVEKYDGVRIFTENDSHTLMEATHFDGSRLIATVNSDLLKWNAKASHPWMLCVTIHFDGENNGGLPDQTNANELNSIEDSISEQLRDHDGYLNIGRQAAKNERLIFYACIEFRKPTNVLDSVVSEYGGPLSIEYTIVRDKYWQTVNHLMQSE